MGVFTNYRKKLNKLLKDRPTYEINPEAFENVAIAKSLAFGRDPSAVSAEQAIERNVADTVRQASLYTNSGTAILSALGSLSGQRSQATQNIAQNEAIQKQRNVTSLMAANQAMIDEKDKAFEYNENMPFQIKVADLRERKAARDKFVAGLVDKVAGTAVAAATGQFGGA